MASASSATQPPPSRSTVSGVVGVVAARVRAKLDGADRLAGAGVGVERVRRDDDRGAQVVARAESSDDHRQRAGSEVARRVAVGDRGLDRGREDLDVVEPPVTPIGATR